MSGSGDVIHSVENVKHRKVDGVLYLMQDRIAFGPPNKSTLTFSKLFSEIKQQKTSPETKEAILLMLVFSDDSNTVFNFCDKEGREKQKEDREVVKNILMEKLAMNNVQISSEIEEKNRLLSENAHLYQLYTELVVPGIVTAEEFWESRQDEIDAAKAKSRVVETGQQVGVSNAFMGDVNTQADGQTGQVKYNLTPEMMEAIFKTYPSIEDKHRKLVPHETTEEQFWLEFFKSHYFYKEKIVTDAKDYKNIFKDCDKKDTQRLNSLIKGALASDVDLAGLIDYQRNDNSEEEPGPLKSKTSQMQKQLIKRYNQQSMLVLATTLPVDEKVTEKAKDNDDGVNKEDESELANLNLSKLDGYSHVPHKLKSAKKHSLSNEDLQTLKKAIKHEFSKPIEPFLTIPPCDSASVNGANGANDSKTSDITSFCSLYPDVFSELKTLTISLEEILRHFWACFPVSSPQTKVKLEKVFETLKVFDKSKLKPFRSRMEKAPNLSDVGHDLEVMIGLANQKFNSWKGKE